MSEGKDDRDQDLFDAARPPTARRRALEALVEREPGRLPHLDGLLLTLREAETVEEGLPPTMDETRRSSLIGSDAITTTWLCWNHATGRPEIARCLRPHLRHDPVWHRRLERGARLGSTVPGLATMLWRTLPWPHVRIPLPGIPLAWRLPVEDAPGHATLARTVAGTLQALDSLHRRGLVHGCLDGHTVLLCARGVQVAWLDPILPRLPTPEADIQSLARLLVQLDPDGLSPFASLLSAWTDVPPSSTGDALRLLNRTMADHLMSERHHLQIRSRAREKQDRSARFRSALLALQRAVPPPVGRCCLGLGADGAMVVVESDGQVVRGGAVAALPPPDLAVLWDRERGLDAQGARLLLRAWSRRNEGDVAARLRLQGTWGGSDAAGSAITRWISGQARLRSARLILERRRW